MFKYGIVFLKNLFKYLEIDLVLFFFFFDMIYDCFKIIGEVVLYDIV